MWVLPGFLIDEKGIEKVFEKSWIGVQPYWVGWEYHTVKSVRSGINLRYLLSSDSMSGHHLLYCLSVAVRANLFEEQVRFVFGPSQLRSSECLASGQ